MKEPALSFERKHRLQENLLEARRPVQTPLQLFRREKTMIETREIKIKRGREIKRRISPINQ